MESKESKAEILAKIQTRLETAGVPFEEIKVFGAIRCNIHVICFSRDTAEKWGLLLAQAFKVKPIVKETVVYAKHNKGSNLNPTTRKGFLIACAF